MDWMKPGWTQTNQGGKHTEGPPEVNIFLNEEHFKQRSDS